MAWQQHGTQFLISAGACRAKVQRNVQRNGNSSSGRNKFTTVTISWQQSPKLWSGLILLKWQNCSRNVAGTYWGGTDTALQMCDRIARVETVLSEGDTFILLINQGCTRRMEAVRFRKSHQTKSRTVSKTNAKWIKSCCLDAHSHQPLKPQAWSGTSH